jgi:hypothetical protein
MWPLVFPFFPIIRRENLREYKREDRTPSFVDVRYASARNTEERVYMRHSLALADGGWKAELGRVIRQLREWPHGNTITPVAYSLDDGTGVRDNLWQPLTEPPEVKP